MFLYIIVASMLVFSAAVSFVCIEDAIRFRD